MNFETVIKILVLIAVATAIPIAAYAAIAGIRGTWSRPQREPDDATAAELDALRDRVRELEAVPQRMAELEERLDFTERLLVQQREAGRLPEATR